MNTSNLCDNQKICVAVILVNWNGLDLTVECIRSLLSGTSVPSNIIVVDNGSNATESEIFSKIDKSVILIKNEKNLGFAEACNIGINYCKKVIPKIDFVWILNNDTIVDKDCLKILTSCAINNPQYICFSSVIHHYPQVDKIWYAGGYRKKYSKGVVHRDVVNISNGSQFVTEFISGCCMFFPADIAFQHIGFIPKYIAYSEDNELCWRLSKIYGDKLLVCTDSKLYHRVSASINKNVNNRSHDISPRATYLMYRNQLWTLRIHSNRKWLHITVNLLIQTKILVKYLFKAKYTHFISLINAIRDGLFTKASNITSQKINE